jgi:hypothetical protein
MSSSSAPRKPATASDSAATSKRPVEARADDAKRHLGGDHPDDAKFAIRDDAGRILAYYADARRAAAALRRYEIIEYHAPPAASANAVVYLRLHHVTCRYTGSCYDRTVGCAHCDAIAVQETASAEALAATHEAEKKAASKQHTADCDGLFVPYSLGSQAGTDYYLRCEKCGFFEP